MLSIEFDAPSFPVGTAVRGKLKLARPMDIKKFTVSLQRSIVLLSRGKGKEAGKWLDLWNKTFTSLTVEVTGAGEVIPFAIPVPAAFYYSSDGQAGDLRVSVIHTVKAVAVTGGLFSSNPQTSAVVQLTSRQDIVPISDVHKEQFYRYCCIDAGTMDIAVSVPNIVLSRASGEIPVTVRVSNNTSGHVVQSVWASIWYRMTLETDDWRMYFSDTAGGCNSVPLAADGTATLPVRLSGKSEWQAIRCGNKQPNGSAELSIAIKLADKDEVVYRKFDLSVV